MHLDSIQQLLALDLEHDRGRRRDHDVQAWRGRELLDVSHEVARPSHDPHPAGQLELDLAFDQERHEARTRAGRRDHLAGRVPRLECTLRETGEPLHRRALERGHAGQHHQAVDHGDLLQRGEGA